jgi:hypothetical protein
LYGQKYTRRKAFKKAKELIANTPCLAQFDPSKLVVLQVDESETGLVGAMLQPTVQGKLQPVPFTSSTMRPTMKFCGHK